MRQIKFRGLRTDGMGFAFGYYCNIQEKEHYILESCALGLAWTEVIPETVGQFTGLKDKNGTEIYEGDKVRRQIYDWEATLAKEEETGDLDVVVYKTEESHIVYRHNGFSIDAEYIGYEGEGLWDWSSIEVIGNIHTTHDKEKEESC